VAAWAAALEHSPGECSQRHEEPVAGCRSRRVDIHQGLVDKAPQGGIGIAVDHRPRAVQLEPPGEDRESGEECLLVGTQPVEAPPDHGLEGAVAGPALGDGKGRRVGQSIADSVEADVACPGGGELEEERHAVELPADLAHHVRERIDRCREQYRGQAVPQEDLGRCRRAVSAVKGQRRQGPEVLV
jgi:hypothetical protein